MVGHEPVTEVGNALDAGRGLEGSPFFVGNGQLGGPGQSAHGTGLALSGSGVGATPRYGLVHLILLLLCRSRIDTATPRAQGCGLTARLGADFWVDYSHCEVLKERIGEPLEKGALWALLAVI